MKTTKHARSRMKDRSIPVLIVKWLLSFGTHAHVGQNRTVIYFDKQARKRLKHDVGRKIVDHLAPLLNAYILVDSYSMEIITAGHRYKRIKRP